MHIVHMFRQHWKNLKDFKHVALEGKEHVNNLNHSF